MPRPARKFGDFAVGETASLDRVVLAEDVERFVELTGDDNPVHVDDEYAAAMGLPARVVHGMLTGGYVSTAIGTLLPGPGALWLSQRFNFRAPVFVGDRIHVEVSVRHISNATRVLGLDVVVRNALDRIVLDGQAQVQVLEAIPEMSPTGEVRTAVVTGSGRGIGAAIARRVARAGQSVVVNYRSDEARARDTVKSIVDEGGDASLFRADVSDPDQARALIAYASETYGPVDALINNAGSPIDPGPLTELSWTEMEAHLLGQLRTSFNCVEAALPGMLSRGFGRIVNVTSQAAYGQPPPKMTGYVVAKAALAAFTRCVALEAGPLGVNVNAVAPGMVQTDMTSAISNRTKAMISVQTPLRRLAGPEDVAEATAFLLGPGGAYITGQTIHLSGGQVMT